MKLNKYVSLCVQPKFPQNITINGTVVNFCVMP